MKTSALATGGGGGGQGAVPLLTTVCAPLISVYSEYVYGILRNDKTTGNNGKKE